MKCKFYLKAVAVLLSVGLLCPVVSGLYDVAAASAEDIECWSTFATEKVLQDEHGIYTKKEAVVKVEACKGEYESTQLIMTAKKNIKKYTVETFDLTSGEHVFEKSRIEVYHQKYITVENIFDQNGMPAGNYPDALLPIETAVKYKENNIQDGNNQGLFITFNVPVSQPAGVYTGNIKISFDGAMKTIPVTLTVYDLEVSQTTHSKSKFNTTFHTYLGELDSTQEMIDSYIAKMAEYRLSPGTVMHGSAINTSRECMEYYVDKAYEIVQNPKTSNFNIPYFTAQRNGQKTFDRNLFIMYVEGILEKSFATGFNLMAKTIFSCGLIDEPDLFGLMDRVPVVCEDFKLGVNASLGKVATIASKYNASPEFVEQVRKALEDLPLIVSMPYKEEAVEMGVETFCPYASEYDSEMQREKYADQEQRWWYTCIKPRPPYPGYHLEDTLISARSLSWMMSEYDVIGNFFWAVDVYAKYDGKNYQFIDDYYQVADRYPQANGDGFLFYPGSPYGLDAPLASMRLEAIRDGNEEYELLYALDNIYKDLGFDFSSVQRNISSLIYSGVKVASTSQMFYNSRQALINLALLANSEAKTCVLDVTDDNYGHITYKVYSERDLYSDGVKLTNGVSYNNGKIYEVKVNLNKTDNVVNFGNKLGDREFWFNFNLGGEATVFDCEDLQSGFASMGANVSVTLENIEQADMVKLNVDKVTDKHQNIKFQNATLNAITNATNKVIIRIYNPTDTTIPFRLQAKFTGYKLNIELNSQELKPGMNEIAVNSIGCFNWKKYQKLDYLIMYFSQSNKGENESKTIYVKDIVVYQN